MTAAGFQRARKPEEISIRRAAILAAAAELFDAAGPDGAGLNAIAARAGFTKSNVYRYFESREAVLISLMVDELGIFAASVERALAEVAPGDLPSVARQVAKAFLEQPRLGRLLGIVSTTLEHNVSAAPVIELKRETLEFIGRMSAALARVVPAISATDCAWATGVIGTYVAGLWPSAHPVPVVEQVLAMPEFSALKPCAEVDLERMILVLLRGLSAAPGSPPESGSPSPPR